MSAILNAFGRIVDDLQGAGVPDASPYWRGEVSRFYTHPTARLMVECVGRGGDKSRTSVMMAIAEVLAGDFRIPPGERHYFTHVSENRDEAAKTLGVLESYLRILKVPFSRTGDTIDLEQLPRGFKVLAARVGAVSGWRCIGWTADEAAKFSNDGSDPSAEVIASIRAMTVTHPNARGRIISTPLGSLGYFYERCIEGNSADQVFGQAATWEANPSVTVEHTHKLERDEKLWRREYCAIAQDGATSALDPDLVRASIRDFKRGYPLSGPVLGFDSSQGRGDATSWCVGCWWQPVIDPSEQFEYTDTVEHGAAVRIMVLDQYGNRKRKPTAPATPKPELVIHSIGAIEGKFASRGITSDDVVSRVASVARSNRVTTILSDQYSGFAYQSAFAKHRLTYVPQPWTVETKAEALLRLRTWLRDGTLTIEPGPEGEALAGELIRLQETIRPSGSIGLAARRGHDDRACALLSLAMGDSVGLLAGSPIQKDNRLVVDVGAAPINPDSPAYRHLRTS